MCTYMYMIGGRLSVASALLPPGSRGDLLGIPLGSMVPVPHIIVPESKIKVSNRFILFKYVVTICAW